MLLWLLDEGWSKKLNCFHGQSISIGKVFHPNTTQLQGMPFQKVLKQNFQYISIFKTHIFYSIPIPELKESRASVTAIKKQAESTNTEYDRLAEENQKLQVRLNFEPP